MGRPRKKNRYRVNEATGCWEWLLAVNSSGYGSTWDGDRIRSAYLVEWERVNGPVPVGLELDHTCRNRLCVNPKHLEPVSRAVNVRRGLNAKLTSKQVEEIREAYSSGSVSQKSLGLRHGVSESCIHQIVSGKSWSAPGTCRIKKADFKLRSGAANRRLSDEDVARIHAMKRTGCTHRELAEKFGVTAGHIRSIIKCRRRFSHSYGGLQ